MPLLVSYKGRYIKHRRRMPGGLRVTFFAAQAGCRGEQLFVAEDHWRLHGRVQFVEPGQLPDRRKPAAAAAE